MPYYDQPEMLAAQMTVWEKYPAWAMEYLKFIIVDDGSPNFPAEALLGEFDSEFLIELYRIKEDIPWNHGGARNLAFDRMEEGWAVLTDIDHVLPQESICSLLTMDLRLEMVYIPARYLKRGPLEWEEISRHSDSFILTREKFWQVGGFDEDLAGYWNGVSGPFRKALRSHAGVIELDHVHFMMYDTDLIKDAHVTSLGRKGTKYDILAPGVDRKKFNQSHQRGGGYQPKNPLRFNWEQVI